MGKKGIRYAFLSAILSLCVFVQQGKASLFEDMKSEQNKVTGKISRMQINTSSIDIDLVSSSGVKKRYQLCRSDLRGRGASVLAMQTAFQSKETVELVTSDAFNSCVDSVAVVQGGK